MKKSDTTFRALASFLFLLSLATVAHAQNTRTWVSGTGNDANPCTYASPCRTFAAGCGEQRRRPKNEKLITPLPMATCRWLKSESDETKLSVYLSK